ncbi:MAG: 6,7-dimethyl-8-ribityllumazine synthase [Vampirovibrionales bacterium]
MSTTLSKYRSHEGALTGYDLKIAVVVSRFNSLVTEKLLDGCIATLSRHGVDSKNIHVFWVPGAFDIPYMAAKCTKEHHFSAIITLGCVIRGETSHYDFVAGECASGLTQLNRKGKTPVVFGVLTTETLEQALDRVGGKHGHMGPMPPWLPWSWPTCRRPSRASSRRQPTRRR